MRPFRFSVIIPILNERENLPILFDELYQVLNFIAGTSEVICAVDARSTDGSLEYVKEMSKRYDNFKYLNIDTKGGQSTALQAGLEVSRGEYIVTIDADLQNDPNDIIKMVNLLDKYDMVKGARANRKDSFLKRNVSKIANYIKNFLVGEKIIDTCCSLQIIRSEYLRKIRIFEGMHRFLPTLVNLEGAKIIQVPVTHRKRGFGISKYGILDRAKVFFFDLFLVIWMKKRVICYTILENNISNNE